ncbi:hypothetical protein T05_1350 [Trichinella murrelli]|uniref:Uncharacterized protein n=1 Tax=Trichinella murrelli TaxID=144512 RepID=A0A0V0SU10_9BILA|nr:hypothetical protein T05_1350 [Trichinella murrelli]
MTSTFTIQSKYKLSDRKRHNKNIDFAKTRLRISGFERIYL